MKVYATGGLLKARHGSGHAVSLEESWRATIIHRNHLKSPSLESPHSCCSRTRLHSVVNRDRQNELHGLTFSKYPYYNTSRPSAVLRCHPCTNEQTMLHASTALGKVLIRGPSPKRTFQSKS